jgi:thioesterase domain-containing protein
VTDDLDLDAVTRGVRSSIPVMETMGLSIVELRRGYAAARIPMEPNGNHIGTMYAGSLFTVAEVLGGVIGLVSFDLDGYFPVVKGVDIAFRRTATSAVRAETTLADDEIDRIQAEALENGKSEFVLDATLTDESGTVVATSRGTYQMRNTAPPS